MITPFEIFTSKLYVGSQEPARVVKARCHGPSYIEGVERALSGCTVGFLLRNGHHFPGDAAKTLTGEPPGMARESSRNTGRKQEQDPVSMEDRRFGAESSHLATNIRPHSFELRSAYGNPWHYRHARTKLHVGSLVKGDLDRDALNNFYVVSCGVLSGQQAEGCPAP